jgi:hypothetical protein
MLSGRITLSAMLAALFLAPCLNVFADDAEASERMAEAKSAFDEGDFRSAGDDYLAADLLADSPEIKLEALKKAEVAFDKADLQYKRYECIKKMIDGFSDRIDFAKAVEAEYAIANKFAGGHCDVTVSWIPWITGGDKSMEIYEAVLEQAPFAKFAPELRLRLGRRQLENGDNKKALKTFRDLMKRHPDSREAKFARFELANALKQMAGRAGDGDGRYTREADAVLKETMKLYPEDPETQWIKESLETTEELKARRLYEWAEFYYSRDNPDAATRYFNDLLARYPTCVYREKAVRRLKQLDPSSYMSPPPSKKKNSNPYPVKPMVYEKEVILVPPEASGGKWLLPIPDLDLDSERADAEHAALKAAEAEKRRKARAKAEADRRAREAAKKRLDAERAAEKKAEEAKKAAEEKIAAEQAKKAAERAKKLEAELAASGKGGAGAGSPGKTPTPKKPFGARKGKKQPSGARRGKKQPSGGGEASGSGVDTVDANNQDGQSGKTATGNSDGGKSALLPAILLVLLAIVAIVYLVFRKKRGERA